MTEPGGSSVSYDLSKANRPRWILTQSRGSAENIFLTKGSDKYKVKDIVGAVKDKNKQAILEGVMGMVAGVLPESIKNQIARRLELDGSEIPLSKDQYSGIRKIGQGGDE